MTKRDLKICVAWAFVSAVMFVAGWIGGKRAARKVSDEISQRFVSPHLTTNEGAEFHVGLECPPGYHLEFIALTPKEDEEFERKPGDVPANANPIFLWDEVAKAEKRMKKLLNNGVCVKGADKTAK
jgi:hypothetical protein